MKRLNRLLILSLCIALTATVLSNAQTTDKNQLKSAKIALFTTRLQLTPAEAEKFWPVFNEYDQKKDALSLEKQSLNEKFRSNASYISEAEVDKIINRFIQIGKEESLLFETYTRRFRTILPAHKIMKLYNAENEFKVRLLKELKGNSKN